MYESPTEMFYQARNRQGTCSSNQGTTDSISRNVNFSGNRSIQFCDRRKEGEKEEKGGRNTNVHCHENMFDVTLI